MRMRLRYWQPNDSNSRYRIRRLYVNLPDVHDSIAYSELRWIESDIEGPQYRCVIQSDEYPDVTGILCIMNEHLITILSRRDLHRRFDVIQCDKGVELPVYGHEAT